MPIYKMDGRKDGLQKYRVRINYIDKDGKSKQLDRVAYGKEAAKDLERKLSIDLKTGDLATCRMTLRELYDEYVKVKSYDIRESTLDKTQRLLKGYVIPELGDTKIEKLNAAALQKWKISLQEKITSKGERLSTAYKRKIFSVFRTLLNYAVKMEYIQKNYLTVLGNFKEELSSDQHFDFYTPEEFIKFLSAARDHAVNSEKTTASIYEWYYYVFFAIAFYTGMRKGEINALRWTDIDKTTIHIKRSISQKLKGADRVTSPKNRSSIRSIQIPLPLQKILDEQFNRCRSITGFKEEWHICGGKESIRDTTLENRNQKFAESAGIKKIRIHDFRHSHASLLANSGINIQEIARRLGHANIEMTWNIYSHLYPQEEEKALEILNKVI